MRSLSLSPREMASSSRQRIRSVETKQSDSIWIYTTCDNETKRYEKTQQRQQLQQQQKQQLRLSIQAIGIWWPGIARRNTVTRHSRRSNQKASIDCAEAMRAIEKGHQQGPYIQSAVQRSKTAHTQIEWIVTQSRTQKRQNERQTMPTECQTEIANAWVKNEI